MKKTKIRNKKQSEIIGILSALIIVMILGMVYCIINIKTPEDKERLALHDHLVRSYIEASCRDRIGQENIVCEVDEEGISGDGDLYVKFWYQSYDPEKHTLNSEKEYRTLYFQHRDEALDGYAEALSE